MLIILSSLVRTNKIQEIFWLQSEASEEDKHKDLRLWIRSICNSEIYNVKNLFLRMLSPD